MALFWSDKLGEDTDGLDILGIRGLDQSLETALANGVTTISLRGRYLTILPWMAGEYFEADRVAGNTDFDLDRFRIFSSRVEYLTLACTALDGSSGDDGGALGSVSHSAVMGDLRSGESIPFPRSPRSAMLGTYFGPCRAIGVMKTSDSGSPQPIALTPRGSEIWSARNAALGRGSLRKILWEADTLTPADVRAVAPHFSLKGLSCAKTEAEHLRNALEIPWEPVGKGAYVAQAYKEFVGTLEWLRTEAKRTPLQADRLLADNYRRAIDPAASEGGIMRDWAAFEWRRRLHCSLELLFSAVCMTLIELEKATIKEVVEEWTQALDLPPLLEKIWPEAQLAWARRGAEAASSVPADIFLGLLPIQALKKLSAHARASAAFALLAGLASQTRVLRSGGVFLNHQHIGERALALIESATEESFDEILTRLVGIVTESHLTTTFRKMANGQKCSLRFFPDGSSLRTTGLSVSPGQSGSRLGNIVRILRDAGFDGMADAA